MKRSWMQTVSRSIKRRGTQGALRRTAARAGALTKRGTIKVSWLRQQAHKNTVTGRRARLALAYRSRSKRR